MLKQEFDDLLNKLDLDRKTFADLTHISYNTVTNWSDDKKPIPSWVRSWLDNYKKASIFDNIIQDIKPYINQD